jgi:hypothetical protein
LDFETMSDGRKISVVRPDIERMVADLRQPLGGLVVCVYSTPFKDAMHGDAMCSQLPRPVVSTQVTAAEALYAHCRPSQEQTVGAWVEVVAVYDQILRTNRLLNFLDAVTIGIAEAHNIFGLKDARENLHPDAVAYAQEVIGSFADMYSSEQVGACIAALLITHDYEGEEHDSPIADFALAVQQQTLDAVSSPTALVENPVRFVVAVVNAAVDHSLAPLAIMEAVLALDPDGVRGVRLARTYADVVPAVLAKFAEGKLVGIVKDSEVFAERHNLVNLLRIHWSAEQVGGQSEIVVPAPLAKLLDFYL